MALAALGNLAACGPEPSILLTTRLPVEVPAGQNEELLIAMCTSMNPAFAHPDDALKVIFYRPGGATAAERIVRCDGLRKKWKPNDDR